MNTDEWLAELGQKSIQEDQDYVVLGVVRKGNFTATCASVGCCDKPIALFEDNFIDRFFYPMRSAVTQTLLDKEKAQTAA